VRVEKGRSDSGVAVVAWPSHFARPKHVIAKPLFYEVRGRKGLQGAGESYAEKAVTHQSPKVSDRGFLRVVLLALHGYNRGRDVRRRNIRRQSK